MIEEVGNIWDFLGIADAICITTNGFVTKVYPQHAVMGRGTALQAKERFRNLEFSLGQLIEENGNIVQVCHQDDRTRIVSFPVKPVAIEKFDPRKNRVVSHVKNVYREGDYVPGFHSLADLEIIKRSACQLLALANSHHFKTIVLPRPGCGAGELSWNQVKPILEEYLDSRFLVLAQTP